MAADSVFFVQEEPRGPSQLIEVPVTSNGKFKVTFPDVQQLRSQANQRIIVKGIRLISADVLTFGPITGFATAPVAELQKISLVIYCEGWEKATNLPILILNDMNLPAGAVPHRYAGTKFNNWENVDWSKTFLSYSSGSAGSAGQPYAVLLDVEYIKLDMDGNVIVGPS